MFGDLWTSLATNSLKSNPFLALGFYLVACGVSYGHSGTISVGSNFNLCIYYI